jgi:anti-sigma regulatory factor (Ser/Thr protein kinase)
MGHLSTAVDRDLDRALTVVTFAGELSLATMTLVRSALTRCLAERPLALVVDIRKLLVTNRVALSAFMAVRRHQRDGPSVRLAVCVAPKTAAGRLVQKVVGRILPVYPSRDRALASTRKYLAAVKQVRVRLAADPRSAGTARRVVARVCADWNLADVADSAQLVVSELVSNAVRHAGTDFDLTATLRGQYLHLGVRDGSPETPQPPRPTRPSRSDVPALTTSGRGLHLVQACAAGWGTTVGTDGKIVWAALRTRTDHG